MSSEKTSVGGTVKLLLVVALVVGGWALYSGSDRKPPRPGVDRDITENIVVTVTLKPTTRINNPAHTFVRVEGVTIDEQLLSRSPYNLTFKIPRGAEVIVTSEQRYKGEIECLIQSDGKFVGRRDRIIDVGTAYCSYNFHIKR